MVVIGKIKISREIKKRLLPPVYEPVVKGRTFTPVLEAPIFSHAPPTLMQGGSGAGGGAGVGGRNIVRSLTENVTIGGGSVNRVVSPGAALGVSYSQTSFTFTSYTIVGGVAAVKTLTESITITEPLAVTRSKSRVIGDSDVSESSEVVIEQRTKTRGLTETVDITDAISEHPATAKKKLLAETVDITEDAARVKDRKIALDTETVEQSDDVVYERPGLTITLVETEEITDAVVFEITYASGHIPKDITENVAVSELVTAVVAKARALVETDPISDNVIRTVTITLTSYTDTSFTQDSYTVIVRNEFGLIETEEISDTVRIALTKNRGLTETVDIVG
jgi:hypothetical protein